MSMSTTALVAEPERRAAGRGSLAKPPVAVKPSTAAAMLDLSRAQIYRLIACGALRRVQIANTRSVRIPVVDIHALIADD